MIPREDVFKVPYVSAAQYRPLKNYVLCKPVDPPSRDVAIWTPDVITKDGTGFVLYGIVISVGPGDYRETRDGKLRFVPTSVKPGEHVVWSHGWGPSLELKDGTHFLVNEQGIHAAWDAAHVHCWHLPVNLPTNVLGFDLGARLTAVKCCECKTNALVETKLPRCGAGLGPRIAEAVIGRDPQKLEVQEALPDPSPARRFADRIADDIYGPARP